MKITKSYLLTPGGAPAKDQTVTTEGEKYTFHSYDTLIAEYDQSTGELKVYPKWDYSNTTVRYFGQYVRELTLFDYKSKAAFLKLAAKEPRITFVKEA